MISLKDKTVIITGGGTGIGRGIALAFGQQGANVVVSGRRSAPLEETVTEIRRQGGRALAFQGDVAHEEDVQRLVKGTVEQYDGVDILVNNAGIGGHGFIHEHDIALWDQIMAINLRGPFLMARAVLPLMRKQYSGHIINISSEGGIEHYPGSGAYGVAKHALNALSEFIQRENQSHNIRVDAICPGMVVSEMTEATRGLNHDHCLSPEDIAELVIWLVTRRQNIKIGRPILIQTMLNPWES
ncbi:MAG: SDR family oxidoreductase [Chloroflexi bacterium]|nr:SDR family oxidoreductase [Chloroflexota bacterium]